MTLDKDDFRRSLGKVKPEPKKKARPDDGKKRTTVRLNAQNLVLLEAVAKAERTTSSSVLDLALELFLMRYATDDSLTKTIEQRRVDSKSPAYECMLTTGLHGHYLALLADLLELPELLTLR